MSAAFRHAIIDSLPNAQIVYDHFHIVKLANEVLSEVRRELVRNAADKKQATEIKGTMWALLHRTENAPEKHLEVINRLRPSEPLGRAYLMKESLLVLVFFAHNNRVAKQVSPWEEAPRRHPASSDSFRFHSCSSRSTSSRRFFRVSV